MFEAEQDENAELLDAAAEYIDRCAEDFDAWAHTPEEPPIENDGYEWYCVEEGAFYECIGHPSRRFLYGGDEGTDEHVGCGLRQVADNGSD